MLEKEIISAVKLFSAKNSKPDDIHGFPHIKRVYNISKMLGKALNANLFVIKIAALLHDIGRKKEEEMLRGINHAEISAEIARNFLNSNNFALTPDDLTNIILSIKAHSFSNNVKPETLEAKIISDADKLDALGAIGLYRTIGFTVKNNGGIDKVIEHLETKILKLKDLLYLDISKKIANKRQEIILEFYNKIINEK
ncbi:MAG: HD domain-containing protein [Promethearchaeota archaeon]